MSNGQNNLFPELSPRAEIFEKVGHLAKSRLDDITFGYPNNFFNLLKSLNFLRLRGTLFEKSTDGSKDIFSLSLNHLSSLYSQNLPIVYVIESKGWEKRILFGTSVHGPEVLKSILTGIAGSSLVEEASPLNSSFSRWSCGTITGIPSQIKIPRIRKKSNRDSSQSIDSLLTVLHNARWIFAVVSLPLKRSLINSWLEQCAMEIQNITESYLVRDIQKANRMASHYVKLLDKTITRLKKGHSEGMWQNGVYFFSEDQVKEGLSLLIPVFSGDQVQPEPIRGHICIPNGTSLPFENLTNSQELSSFINFPQREYQGFRLKEWVDFDLDFYEDNKNAISVGKISAYDVTSDQEVKAPVADLTRHGLVAGATGSGKTNTLFHILIQLWHDHKVPFLVIEPTKAEYRNLSTHIKDMLIFTLGEESPGRSSPFRLNPFQFPEGVSLQTHIDYLKAVFNASFVMYAPTPYILEECLYEVYKDKGWGLVTSHNARGMDRGAFPTLSDLYLKIDDVVDRIGYEDRITMDIKSALKTRINNLRVGSKGLMLDTKVSTPFSDLMFHPTLLELKYMGNDDEKTFIMGLILTALFEFYDSGQDEFKEGSKLHHITLIEEAHRLLKNVPTEKATEDSANMKGKAVETFCNLLAEIRAYGEGILVSEQIPTKLAPDILKNTNLKILHRMVSKEERESMGHTMNLDDKQMRYVSTLSQGEAVFFREGIDRPLLIRIPLAAVSTSAKMANSVDVSQKMIERFFQKRLTLLFRFEFCQNCRLKLKSDCENVVKVIDRVKESADLETEAVRRYFPLVLPRDNNWGKMVQTMGHKSDDSNHQYCLDAHLISIYVQKKGDFHQWDFEDINRILKDIAARRDRLKRLETLKRQCLEKTSNANPPHPLCRSFCQNVCIYGYDIGVITKDPGIHNRFVEILESPDKDHRLINNLQITLSKELIGWLGETIDGDQLNGMCICYEIQKMDELGIRQDLQEKLLGRR